MDNGLICAGFAVAPSLAPSFSGGDFADPSVRRRHHNVMVCRLSVAR